MWEVLMEVDLSTQWQYSLPTEHNIFRFTVTQPFNLNGFTIAQAETGDLTQLFDLQRLAIRSESEICIIEKPTFFTDRRIAVRGNPYASNKNPAGNLKVEGMSMAIDQPVGGISGEWTRRGSQLVSPVQELSLQISGDLSAARVFQSIPSNCLIEIDSVDYVFIAKGNEVPDDISINFNLEYFGAGTGSSTSYEYFTLLTSQLPETISDYSDAPYEAGVKFKSSQAGEITHIRFWKPSGETGSHTGRIWSVSGTLLASALFTNESAEGWQEISLPAPLAISANTPYVMSINVNTKERYTDTGFWNTITNGPLSIVRNSEGFGNTTTHSLGLGEFPGSNSGAWNPFVDVRVRYATSTPENPVAFTTNRSISSERFTFGSFEIPESANKGQPDKSFISYTWDTGSPAYKLEGCSVLKYHLIWN